MFVNVSCDELSLLRVRCSEFISLAYGFRVLKMKTSVEYELKAQFYALCKCFTAIFYLFAACQ